MFRSSARSLFTRPNGFTLVELLIVVSIITIMTGAMVPSFAGYIKNQGLKQATEQLKSDLRVIQNKALTGALSDQTISGNPIKYWGIRFANGAQLYEYFTTDTNATCPASIPAAQLQGNARLSSDLDFKFGAAGYKCVFFNLSNGNISTQGITLTNSTAPIIVGKVGSITSGDCRRIIFTVNGLIYSSSSVLCT